jgi:hypothetical protein
VERKKEKGGAGREIAESREEVKGGGMQKSLLTTALTVSDTHSAPLAGAAAAAAAACSG